MPYWGPSPKTLLVDGTDIQSLPYLTVTDFSGLYAPGLRRGSDRPIPGRRGALAVTGLVYDAYAFSIPIALDGDTEAEFEANLRAVVAAVGGTDGLVTLTRRLAAVGGFDEHTAGGRFVGSTSFNLLNPRTGVTELQFVNLDGAWSPDDGATWLVP